MGILALLRRLTKSDKEARILILGLDNAGKTTILRVLCEEGTKEASAPVEPTLGFDLKQLQYSGFKLNVWDVGGQKSIRAYWRNYFEGTDVLIWVVDGADEKQFAESVTELSTIMKEDKLAHCPILIFKNKADLLTCIADEDVAKLFQRVLDSRTYRIQSCSAKTSAAAGATADDKDGLQEGMRWVFAQIEKQYKSNKTATK